MAKKTNNYKLTYLERGDVWAPNIDRQNMQSIENLLKSAELFAGEGLVDIGNISTLSSASDNAKLKFYNAAFNYFDPLFSNVAKCGCQFISNEDAVVDLVSTTNINTSTILSTSIDGSIPSIGQIVFLTAQTVPAENGIYSITSTGATRLASQPKKIFINNNSESYAYSVWKFSDELSSKPSLNLSTCIIVVDGLVALEVGKTLTPTYTCYLKSSSSGSQSLMVYAPSKFYGTGTPILYLTGEPEANKVNLINFSATYTPFNDFYSVKVSEIFTGPQHYLIDFNKQTYFSRDSYKNLHKHNNASAKLSLSNSVKIILKPSELLHGACDTFSENGNIFKFDPSNQIVNYFYINGQQSDIGLVEFDAQSSRFNIGVPVSTNDELYLLISESKEVVLEPISGNTYRVRDSSNVSPSKWSLAQYDNYQLWIGDTTISQASYVVNNTDGTVDLEDPNVSNINAISDDSLANSKLVLSSSKLDYSSFFGATDRIDRVHPKDVSGKYLWRGDHNQFSTQKSLKEKTIIPLHTYSQSEYKVPYFTKFNDIHPTDPVNDIVDAISYNGSMMIATTGGGIYAVHNNILIPVFEEYSDIYPEFVKFKKVKNSDNKFIVWLRTGKNNFFGLADFDNFDFSSNELILTEDINDIAVIEIDGDINYYICTDTKISQVDFSNISPSLVNLFFSYTYGSNTFYSYLKSGAKQLAISAYTAPTSGSAKGSVSYEIYAVVPEVGSGGPSGILAIKSNSMVVTGTPSKIFEIDSYGGISDNGIIAITNSQCQITTSPIEGRFPLTYGINLSVTGSQITAKTGSITSITNISGSYIVNSPITGIDTVFNSSDYLLIRHQPNPTENGIYLVTTTGSSLFSARKMRLDSSSGGNYIKVQQGPHYANSYWELDNSSSETNYQDELFFRLRSTDLTESYTGSTRAVCPQKNTIMLVNGTTCHIIYDSSYVTSDTYAHQKRTTTVLPELLTAEYDRNIVVSKKSIVSDRVGDMYAYPLSSGSNADTISGLGILNFQYPLTQGSEAGIIGNTSYQWHINQLIDFKNDHGFGQGVIKSFSGANFNFEVVSTDSTSLGQINVHPGNFTFQNLINNEYFDQLWYSQIYYTNHSNYLSKLDPSNYIVDTLSRSIKLATGSSYSGSILYAEYINLNNNILIDSKNKFNAETNISNDSDIGNIIGEFNPTDEGHIIDHSTSDIVSMPSDPILFSSNGTPEYSQNQEYDGIINFKYGSKYINSVALDGIPDEILPEIKDESEITAYSSNTIGSFSIEDKLYGRNTFSSQGITNSIILDQLMSGSIAGYSPYYNSNSITSITIDPSSGSTFENSVSDIEPGLTNYSLNGIFPLSRNAVSQFININDELYSVGQGIISSVNSPRFAADIPIITLPFDFCFDLEQNGELINLATNNGLFVIDTSFNFLTHSCAGSSVTKILNATQEIGFTFYAIDNSVVCIKLSDKTSDIVHIPCAFITSMCLIEVKNPSVDETYILVGTDQGLFALTVRNFSSSQVLPIQGDRYLGAKQITLSPENRKQKLGPTKNSIARIYDPISDIFENDITLDQVGQPFINDITVSRSNVYISTDNGISKYDNLYNIDLYNYDKVDQEFLSSSILLSGLDIYKIKPLSSPIDSYSVITNDGMYFSFDGLRSFLRSNMSQKALTANGPTGAMYFGTDMGYSYTFNYGQTFTDYNMPRTLTLDETNTAQFIFSQSLGDIVIDSINVPLYNPNSDWSNPITFQVGIYTPSASSGSNTLLLATAATSPATYWKGMNIIKFNIPMTLIKNVDYVMELDVTATAQSALIFESNITNEYINVKKSTIIKSDTYTSTNFIPAFKLCTSSTAGSAAITVGTTTKEFTYTSNITSASGALISPYPFADLEFIVDNSRSSINTFSTPSNINTFVSSVKSALASKFNLSSHNVVFADVALSNINTVSVSGPISITVAGSTGSTRIIDAISAVIARTNPGPYATPIVSGDFYNPYIAGIPVIQRDYEFKKILRSIDTMSMAKLEFNYNTVLPNGVSSDITIPTTQSGILTSLVGYRPYVFIKDRFIGPADYTISQNSIQFNTAPTGSYYNDVEIYFTDTSYPSLSTLSSIETQSKFSGPWSSHISHSTAKIIVVLSDYIDNASVVSINDFISSIEDKFNNVQIILCGTSSVPGELLTAGSKVISMPINNTETFSAYTTRVANTISTLKLPIFAGQVAFIADHNVVSFNASFTNLTVYYDIKDLATNAYLGSSGLTSSSNVILNQTPNSKFIKIYAQGSGSITQINLNYVIPTEYAISMKYNSGSQFKNYISILNNTYNINNSAVYATANSGSKIELFDKAWGYSPSSTPSWIQNTANALNTGPSIKTTVVSMPQQFPGLQSYLAESAYIKRLPLKTIFTSTTGPQEIILDSLEFDPSNVSIDELAGVVDTIIDRLNLNSDSTSGSESLPAWWNWLRSYKRGLDIYRSSISESETNLKDKSTLFALLPSADSASLTYNEDLKARFDIKEIAGVNDKFSHIYSMPHTMVNQSSINSYFTNAFEIKLDSNRVFKPSPSSENYRTVSPHNNITLYGMGDSSKNINKIICRVFHLGELDLQRTVRPSLPTPVPDSVSINKYKSSQFTVVGFSETFNSAGRKLKIVSSSGWQISGSTLVTGSAFSSAYGYPHNYFQSLSINNQNTAGESNNTISTQFSHLDGNYTPMIISVDLLSNNQISTTAGINDLLTINAVINRNDGLVNAEYIYQFNIGDQIFLSVSWFGCSVDGSVPVLLSSSNDLKITSDIYTKYKNGYIYAEVTAKRGLTIGNHMSTKQAFIV